jgi:hypothetical protein
LKNKTVVIKEEKMIKIKAKNGELKAEMKGSPFEILNEAIVITKMFYTTFNKKLPKLGDYYVHKINTELKEEENEEPTDFEKELVEIIEDVRKAMAEEIEEGEEENEKDSTIYQEHKRHRRH